LKNVNSYEFRIGLSWGNKIVVKTTPRVCFVTYFVLISFHFRCFLCFAHGHAISPSLLPHLYLFIFTK